MKTMTLKLLTLMILISSEFIPAVEAADLNDHQLNPMVLIMLSANMKADWILAERQLTREITDELDQKQDLSEFKNHSLKGLTSGIDDTLAVNNVSYIRLTTK